MLVDHVTAVTPTLSLAVPLKTMDDADVEIDDDEGDPMVSEGGVVLAGVVAAWRVITKDCAMWVLVSVAVTVIVFAPEAKGTLATVQVEPEPCAVPEDPVLTVHVTTIGPLPPVSEPESAIDGAVVVAAGAFTTSVIGT